VRDICNICPLACRSIPIALKAPMPFPAIKSGALHFADDDWLYLHKGLLFDADEIESMVNVCAIISPFR
jgi:hypothetical protein